MKMHNFIITNDEDIFLESEQEVRFIEGDEVEIYGKFYTIDQVTIKNPHTYNPVFVYHIRRTAFNARDGK
jgi:hypothetical protein